MEEKKIKVNNKKRFIVFCICILVILLVAILIIIKPFGKNDKTGNENVQNNDVAKNEIDMNYAENVQYINGEKVNISERMYHEHRKDDLIYNISNIKADKKECKISLKVQNIGSADFAGKKATLTFLKGNGDVYGKVDTYIGQIPVGKSTTVEITTTLDITNALDHTMEFAE